MTSNSNTYFLKFLAFSAIIHLGILILNLNNEINQQTNEDKQNQQQTNLIDFETIYPPDDDIDSTTLEPIDTIDGMEQAGNKDCEEGTWYGGIGVKVLFEDESVVLSVFDGYPAQRAGILPDDRLTSLNDGQIKGEPGSLALIQINRDGLVHVVSIIREKICYGN